MHTTFCQLACKLHASHMYFVNMREKAAWKMWDKKKLILAPMLIYFACIIYIILSLSLSLPLSHLSDGKESQQVTGVIIMFPHKLGP